MHSLQVENYVLFGGLSEDFPGLKRSGRSQDIQEFCNKDQGVRASKDYC